VVASTFQFWDEANPNKKNYFFGGITNISPDNKKCLKHEQYRTRGCALDGSSPNLDLVAWSSVKV
jgi:hypothetical protein